MKHWMSRGRRLQLLWDGDVCLWYARVGRFTVGWRQKGREVGPFLRRPRRPVRDVESDWQESSDYWTSS